MSATAARLVNYERHGGFEIVDPELLDSVSAGWFRIHASYSASSADHVCGSTVDAPCNTPSNDTCVSPDGICGSNVACDNGDIGA